MSSLASQVVLVTGCSSGIGRALARAFHAAGHRTFASARRTESVAELQRDGLETVALDVTNDASISRAVGEVVERAGRIDILVNNAGINLFGPSAEVPLDGFRKLFETNVTGALAMIQAVFPHMAKARRGRIVNVGSIVGVLPTPFAGAYCASKSALHALSDVLRMELAPFGIDLIVVQPGGVRSNIATAGSEGLERYGTESSRYRPVHEQIVKRANASQQNPMAAEDFASRLVAAVTRGRAPRVVRLGAGVGLFSTLARLPGPAVDRLMTRQFHLDRLRRSQGT